MPEITSHELARLRGIEEAARWHLAHSACSGWEQGEVLALALGIDPEGPRKQFWKLLDALGIPHDRDPLADLFGPDDDGSPSTKDGA